MTTDQLVNRLQRNSLRAQVEAKVEIDRLNLHAQTLMNTALQQHQHSPGLSDVLLHMWREACVKSTQLTSRYMRMK